MSCPECFQGTIHIGQPRGKVTKLHGLDTYVTEPVDGREVKGIIIIIPDAFGWVFINNRLLADHYADKGDYRVYVPDFMAGWSAPLWLLDLVRKTTNLPIFAAGFCWGGKHVCLLAADTSRVNGKLLIDAGFTGHPSLLKVPSDIEKMKIPVSFAIGDQDSHLPLEVSGNIKDIVEAKPEEQRGEVVLYKDCSHGFCVRADIRFEEVARQAEAAEDQCIQWYDKHLGTEGH
ncbi:related to dienelactone hydrolase family protein [Phialocephala subalpina]|uniref:Related to dienelactone hydrolase family protein n=1 Tax=Phialocephala subalpina TaxID=576137 RepID=A0A1L7XXX0_9HELO|nr:related to dienelactone hydrolase family protein [Phialocephala subalpina]